MNMQALISTIESRETGYRTHLLRATRLNLLIPYNRKTCNLHRKLWKSYMALT